MARKKKKIPSDPRVSRIDALAHDARGIARIDGKTTFVDGALAGEEVEFVYTSVRRDYAEGRVLRVIEASPVRVRPRCEYFGICGGCSLQHIAPPEQIVIKQQTLVEQFRRIGGLDAVEIWPPLTGPYWGYRNKARLGVKLVPAKGRVLVGFREKRSSYLADMTACETLHPAVGSKLGALSELVASLSIAGRLPQIEVAVAENARSLVFRTLDPPNENDCHQLQAFGEQHGFDIYTQSGGPDSVKPLQGEARLLTYSLPAHDVRCWFEPLQFTQVNPELNRKMVDRALELLDPQAEDRVLDLFCGIGNFTLPLARYAGSVIGIEGEAGLVARARENARANQLDNVQFHVSDLTADTAGEAWSRQRFTKALLDPARTGAQAILGKLADWGVQRVVYVSCNPATLARDAGILVKESGFELRGAGVMDMFPQTSHVESIALFEKT